MHLLEWPELPENNQSRDFALRWNALRELRETVNEAIEPLRRDKIIRSSLEATVALPDVGGILGDYRDANFLSELFITGTVVFDKNVDRPMITKTTDHKCGRCWRLLPEVAEDGALCGRCESVVSEGVAHG